MGSSNNGGDRRRNLESSCIRYVVFSFCVSLLLFHFVGWPSLLAWVGLAWSMYQVCAGLQGSQSIYHPHQSKPKRRCRDRSALDRGAHRRQRLATDYPNGRDGQTRLEGNRAAELCPSVMNCVTSPSAHPAAIGETDLTRLHQLNKNTQGTKTMETAMTVACIIGLVAGVFHQGRRKGSRRGYRAGWQRHEAFGFFLAIRPTMTFVEDRIEGILNWIFERWYSDVIRWSVREVCQHVLIQKWEFSPLAG